MVGRFRVRGAFVVLALALVAGCALPSPEMELTQGEWASIDTLAIAPGPGSTEVGLWVLNAKTGAVVGATQAMEIADLLTLGLWPLAFYGAGAVCVPALGAGIGALYGAIRAPDEEEVEQVRRLLFDAVTPACLPQVIQQDLVEHGTNRAVGRRIVALEPVQGRAAADRAEELREEGIDAVLEFTIVQLEVSGPFGTHPRGALQMRVHYQVVQTGSGNLLLWGTVESDLPAERVGPWWRSPGPEGEDLRQRLREALEAISRAAAHEVRKEVFEKHPALPPFDIPEPPAEPGAEAASSRESP